MSTQTQKSLADLVDRVEITKLMLTFVGSLDRRDWAGYAQTFTEDGVFEIMGQRRIGHAEIAAGPERDLGGFARTQHFSTNHTIELAGDSATATHDLLAVHVPDAGRPDEHADIGGLYRCQCTRTAEGWRFEHVALEICWTAGQQFGLQPPDSDTGAN
ncbi:MAG: nuclear transport factor 2 family protein [Solirubrobacteraceae bacterium]